MASNERGGVASVYVNGALIEVSAEIEVKLGAIVRTPKLSSNGVAGFTTKAAAPEVTLEGIDGPQVSVLAFKAIVGQTMLVQLNNGKTYQLYDATQIDDPSLKIHEGNISDLKFTGSRCQEILPS